MKNLILNLFSIISVVISGILLFNGMNGWGWFLFVGLITHSSQGGDE